MLAGIVFVAAICAWLAVFIWIFHQCMEDARWFLGLGAFAVFTLGPLFGSMITFEKKNPCVRYETQMSYNAATKTMMPMRICVLRGEWVE